MLKENNWYLRAFCLKRNAFRIFKLRRIQKMNLLPETFTPREFDMDMNDFKSWQSDKMIVVSLLLDASLKERALDYCREEYMKDLGNGKIHVDLPFVESEMGYGMLMSFGHHCEVLYPPHIRAEFINRIQQLHKVYV